MKMFRKKWLVIGAVAVVAVVLALPYISWLSYESDVAAYEEPVWPYPFERGREWNIGYTLESVMKSVWPYFTADVDLSVNQEYFDVIYEETPPEPESVSFVDYFSMYYGISAASFVPDDSKIAVVIRCQFEDANTGIKWYLDLSPDNLYTKDAWYGYDTAGTYSESFVLYTRGYSGTYTWSLTVLTEGSPDVWNVTIAWDKVVVVVVNPWEGD